MMTIDTIVGRADEALSSRRVFGEPVVKNGITVIPVAKIIGGAGGGEGPTPSSSAGEPSDETAPTRQSVGGGFGMAARPAGVYVLQGERVRWIPALDVNRIIVGMQIVAIVLLLTVRSIVRSRTVRA
jgi:uncharacterized spore protein YtfJ